jgi:hypothetical protein
MKALAEFAKDALELPAEKRLTLARILLELSDEETDVGAGDSEAAWEEVIASRMEAVKGGSARASDLDEVMARLERRAP